VQYRFDPFVLDAARRELRSGEVPIEVQPLVFELLLYLIAHRDRVVPKDELLDSIWADSAVTEASLARVVSLARRAIGDGDRAQPFIRTHPRIGYRFTAQVAEDTEPPESMTNHRAAPGTTHRAAPGRSAYANAGGTHIAYQVVGDGPLDVVLVNGWVLSVASVFDDDALGPFLERLAAHARLIVFDKRGTGLSDRVKDLPGLARRMEDLTAVLDAVGSQRAHVVGVSEGAPMSLLYAACHPERVSGLALIGGFARMTRDADQPFGWSSEDIDRLDAYIRSRWGEGRTLSTSIASRQNDPVAQRWAASAEAAGGSPGAAIELWNMNRSIDVREVLPVLRTPCVVLHSKRDPVIDIAHGRQLAERIDGARFVELDGVDHLPFFGEVAHRTLAELVEWLEGPAAEPTTRRRLATLLLLELGGAPDDDVTQTVEQLVPAHHGVRAQAADAPWAALFDGPAQAARCALAIRSAAARRGLTLRGALQCGEVEVQDPAGTEGTTGVAGAAVDDAHALLDIAIDGEIWTTQSVVDLVPGSGIEVQRRAAPGRDARAIPYAIEAG